MAFRFHGVSRIPRPDDVLSAPNLDLAPVAA